MLHGAYSIALNIYLTLALEFTTMETQSDV
jgi:hypothetical protein